MKRRRPPPQPKKINHHFLKNEAVKTQFNVTLSNRFEVLGQENTDGLHQKRETIKSAITDTCEEILGKQEHTHKEWMTPAILEKLEKRRKKKQVLNINRTRATKAAA